MLENIDIKDALLGDVVGCKVCIRGWVKTRRVSKNVIFVNMNDGTTIKNLQVVIETKNFDEKVLSGLTNGASICVEGILHDSLGVKGELELLCERIMVMGACDESYQIQPKKHSLDFLRSVAHLRIRTSTYSAIFRVRNAITYSIHKFFQERGFINVHTPIITTTDGEGAGEMFTVTTRDIEGIRGKIDFGEDFFGTKASLTVTGQLEAETAIFGLNKVYTLGPTFRAENSNTARHLAEFWMMEPEMAFYDLRDNIKLATEMLKYVIGYCLETCDDDLAFLESKREGGDDSALRSRLRAVVEDDFVELSYTEAIDILKNCEDNKIGKFKYVIKEWGVDLQTEHERYLVESYFKKPVIIKNYPRAIKAFYMRQNEDEKTVAAMDILFPGIGEIIGGSQREERFEKLLEAIANFNIDEKTLDWYVDTRRFGSVVHSGFGLGVERLVMFVTGMENIRDVILFPRTPGNAKNCYKI